MIQTKEAVVNRRPMHYNGIHHAMTSNDQEDLFRAYQSFACHHTINDADMYENAASIASLSEQKKFFLGLAGCKRTVVQKLKMNGSDNSVSFSSQRNTNVGNLTRYIMDLDAAIATIMAALNSAEPGDTYVPDIPAVKIIEQPQHGFTFPGPAARASRSSAASRAASRSSRARRGAGSAPSTAPGGW